MPRRATRTVPTVLVHGLHGNEPGHWQTWLAEELRGSGREVRYPEFPDLDRPDPAAWHATLRAVLSDLPDDGFDVVCHSLGVLLWLHHVAEPARSPRPARVALVSPPSPHSTAPGLAPFLPAPLSVDALRHAAGGTVLVGGTNDPYCPEGVAAAYGVPLKTPTTVVPDGGHLNVAAGLGPWPAMLAWCGRDKLAFVL
jgi:uncharacterized protein